MQKDPSLVHRKNKNVNTYWVHIPSKAKHMGHIHDSINVKQENHKTEESEPTKLKLSIVINYDCVHSLLLPQSSQQINDVT